MLIRAAMSTTIPAQALAASASTQHNVAPGFKVLSASGNARTGILTTRSGDIQTPGMLMYTRRGGPLALTADMVEKLDPLVQGVQVDIMQFLDSPDPATLKAYGGGVHGFLALRGYSVFASNRDPSLYSYGSKASSDKEVYVLIHSGGQQVSVLKYMDVVGAMQPDAYITMCDEVPADARPKRMAVSMRRTAAWADACIGLHEGRGLGSTLAFAAISGGGSVEGRRAAAKAMADKPVAGYALCGFGTGETPAARPGLIRAALEPLQQQRQQRAVHITGLTTLDDILDAIAEGVDLFDFALPAALAAGGYALSFPLSPPAASSSASAPSCNSAGTTSAGNDAGARDGTGVLVEGLLSTSGRVSGAAAAAAAGPGADSALANADSALPGDCGGDAEVLQSAAGPGPSSTYADPALGADDRKLNLWSTSYRLDKGPLVPGCTCFACSRHSRAYVHHLLNTHEMLADVLLDMHNHHHLLAWFKAVRNAISEGRFDAYRTWWSTLQSTPLQPNPSTATRQKRSAPGLTPGSLMTHQETGYQLIKCPAAEATDGNEAVAEGSSSPPHKQQKS